MMRKSVFLNISYENTDGVTVPLLRVIDLLHTYERVKKYHSPDVDLKFIFNIKCTHFGNIIPTYIKPKNEYDLSKTSSEILDINIEKSVSAEVFRDTISDVVMPLLNIELERFWIPTPVKHSSFDIVNDIWNKYFYFDERILQKLLNFNRDTTLGVHFRGTDKQTDINQTNGITEDEFILIIEDHISKNNHIDTIFCCSDEQSFVEGIKNNFPNMVVLENEQTRIFWGDGKNFSKNEQDELVISVFLDILSLSKCNVILKTSSAMSCFSKIFNPKMEIYTKSAMKKHWFPASLTQIYKTDSDKINKILERTMQDHINVTD